MELRRSFHRDRRPKRFTNHAQGETPMKHARGRSTAAMWVQGAGLLATLLLPAAAAAEIMIPVTINITELVQLDADQDPGVGGVGQSLADLYAHVTIDGTTLSNFDDKCDNPPPTPPEQSVFSVPYVFFNQDGTIVDPSCPVVPWVFTKNVPLSRFQQNPAGIAVRIQILDSDSGPLNDDDLLEDFVLNVSLGGRWTGAKDWPENCRDGSDADVCWQIEAGADADGDGLLDDWETNGLDADGDGTIDVNLPAFGANPNHKDVFVELDWRPGFEPRRAEVRKWKDAFAASPIDAGGVPNPDGLPGINLHVDTGALTENGLLVGDNLGGGNALSADFPVCSLSNDTGAFYPAKAANFDAARRSLVFRYGITSTQCCEFGPSRGTPCFIDAQCPSALCQPAGGQAEIGGNDLVVWNTAFQGSSLMHELGHTLNLHHGGDVDDNCKPNYLSVMNYDHFELQRLDGSSFLDYSPPRLPGGTRGQAPLGPLAENDLDEPNVLDPTDPQTFFVYTDAAAKKRLTLVGAAVDWNGNGTKTENDLTVNIDTADATTGFPDLCKNTDIRTAADPLTGFDDWHHVSLPFIQFADSADGPVNPVLVHEPTDAEIRAHREALNTADLAIVKTGPAGPVEAGSDVDLAYTLSLANKGQNPAVKVRVSDTLPPGGVATAADPACDTGTAGSVVCDLPAMLPSAQGSVALSVRAPARCENGHPVAIVNHAAVANAYEHAGADPTPADNSTTFETAVADTTPPTLALTVTPATLWPVNHKLVAIKVSAESTDACDPNPTIRLVSITSNETPGINGAGHQDPDIDGAVVGLDDFKFKLRAERSGTGNGRVYTIRYAATDASGNTTESTVTVTVPKSQAP